VASFLERVKALPRLGIGVSTEYGAGDSAGALDVLALREAHPRFAQFLEVGVETAKGLDRHASAWVARGLPTTYHFLDVNLDEREDVRDEAWLDDVRAIVRATRPAWLCGDAGMWHLGRRERGHMLLLPPVLSEECAKETAEGVAALREATGKEVFPENPPGQVWLGDMHVLDFFARVAELGDTGLLLDCAHLAIYQKIHGHDPLTALDGLPLDRVIELHVAGSTTGDVDGYAFLEDDHVPRVLDETWKIFEHVAARAPNLKAVVFECERNPMAACVDAFGRIDGIVPP